MILIIVRNINRQVNLFQIRHAVKMNQIALNLQAKKTLAIVAASKQGYSSSDEAISGISNEIVPG